VGAVNHLFTTLQTTDFEVQFFALSNPSSMYSLLHRHPVILMLRASYQKGIITAIEIEDWVDKLLEGFLKGKIFVYQDALSAIAVALEPCEDKFAAEYINDLASLQLAELQRPRYIAKLCQENRSRSHISVHSQINSEQAVP
jgi:hypothetical protein